MQDFRRLVVLAAGWGALGCEMDVEGCLNRYRQPQPHRTVTRSVDINPNSRYHLQTTIQLALQADPWSPFFTKGMKTDPYMWIIG